MAVNIYHNPRCSKSRATLKLLEEQGITPDVILYLENPPSKTDLKSILKSLGKMPQELIRFNESVAKDLGLSAQDDRSEDEWLDFMLSHAVLIERPIVVSGNKAVIGRPPENVLEIL